MKTKPIISVRKIHKWYGSGENKLRYHALRGISFDIEAGEFAAIMGPSGSGKSTLMNVIGCLDRFDKGELVLAGEKVRNLDDLALAKWRGEKIGFVFQSFNLLNKYSVLENVGLPSLYVDIENAQDRAKELLEQVELGDKLVNTPLELSGGQKQRVAIARALMADPEIVLADEPTGNLDSKSGENIMDVFTRLNEEGKTIVVITHDKEVAKFAGRVIELHDGKMRDG